MSDKPNWNDPREMTTDELNRRANAIGFMGCPDDEMLLRKDEYEQELKSRHHPIEKQSGVVPGKAKMPVGE